MCTNCLDSERWACIDCLAKANVPAVNDRLDSRMPLAAWIFSIAFAMIVIGIILIAAGSFSGNNGGVSGGGVILIGPIPIILGTGPYSFSLIVLSVVLTVFALAFFLLLRWKIRR